MRSIRLVHSVVVRGFCTVWRDHVKGLTELLGTNNIYSSLEDMAGFTTDWTRQYKPHDKALQLVALPRSTSDVQKVVCYCNLHGLSLIPQGGNTGLVGGGVGLGHGDESEPLSRGGEVILSLSRMNSIIEVDVEGSLVVCEAGAVLQSVNDVLEKDGLMLPIDLGSKGQCLIGGNVATNAGGLNVIRHGPLSGHVLGLEVVTGDGRVLNMLRTLRKDNMGLHTPLLFIGSEGALGVITKVSMGLVPIPRHRQILLCKLRGFQGVVGPALHLAKAVLGESLSAFEFMDSCSVGAVQRAMPDLVPQHLDLLLPHSNDSSAIARPGIDGEILLLLECSSATELGDRLHDYLVALSSHSPSLLAEGGYESALVSQSQQQHKLLWRIRENVPVALARLASANGGRLYKHDISLPLGGSQGMSAAVAQIKEQMKSQGFRILPVLHHPVKAESSIRTAVVVSPVSVACFGHAGDGNLHLNILAEGPSLIDAKALIDCAVVEAVATRNGSLSAEHGVGQKNLQYLSRFRNAEELRVMVELKRLFDPNNVLQKSKVLPALGGHS